MKHTPAPWNIEECKNKNYHHYIIGEHFEDIALVTTEANARRIVACVNACEGIETEDIEKGIIKETRKLYHESSTKNIYDEVKIQELLGACKVIKTQIMASNMTYQGTAWFEFLEQAIAKAEEIEK